MFTKIKISKHIIEVKEYETLSLANQDNVSLTDYGESDNYESNYLLTVKRRCETVRDLAIMNFDVDTAKFLTLTFRDTDDFNIRSVQDCALEFQKFIKRLRYYYPDIKYLAVVEFQDKNDRGAVHYHVLIQLPYIPMDKLYQIWSHGWIFINKINHVDNIGAYVTKYMTKDNADIRLQKVKGYYCSQGLARPYVLKSWDLVSNYERMRYFQALDEVRQLQESGKGCYYKTLNTDHGIIKYTQYNTKR